MKKPSKWPRTGRTPIGGWARVEGEALAFDAIIIKPDGSQAHRTTLEGTLADAEHVGTSAGAELRDRGGSDFFVVG